MSDVAKQAYHAYGEVTDFKNYQGLPMPEWDALTDTIKAAWQAAVESVQQTDEPEQVVIIDSSISPVYCRVQTDKLTITGWMWNGGEMIVIQPSVSPIQQGTILYLLRRDIRSITPVDVPIPFPEIASEEGTYCWVFRGTLNHANGGFLDLNGTASDTEIVLQQTEAGENEWVQVVEVRNNRPVGVYERNSGENEWRHRRYDTNPLWGMDR